MELHEGMTLLGTFAALAELSQVARDRSSRSDVLPPVAESSTPQACASRGILHLHAPRARLSHVHGHPEHIACMPPRHCQSLWIQVTFLFHHHVAWPVTQLWLMQGKVQHVRNRRCFCVE